MRALVYLEPGSVELREHPAPRVGHDDDVVVSIVGTGICGTDRKILLGRFPARPGVVLGHESVGLVDEVGSRRAVARTGRPCGGQSHAVLRMVCPLPARGDELLP